MPKKIGTLIKTYQGTRKSDTGAKYDTLLVFYRDENGEKKTIFYDRPETEYWIIKDKSSEAAQHPPLYIPSDLVDRHVTYSDNLYRDIAINTGTLAFYDKVKFNYGLNSGNMKNLFKSPLIYGADIDLQDQYIARFYREFDPDPNYKLHKCYFDIEVDIYNYPGFAEPLEAPCPVCLITLIDEKDMKCYTFILRNQKNTKLTLMEQQIDSFKQYMENTVHNADDIDLEYELYYYSDEIELIKAFFDKVHEIDPDYCSGWNISYDIQYLVTRLGLLNKGLKHKEMSAYDKTNYEVCDKKYLIQKNTSGVDMYLTPYFRYSVGQGKTGKRTDYFKVLDGVNWVCQMLTYGVVHAGEGKPDSYKLDFISYLLLNKEKLPYAPGETIRNRLYKNPKGFVEYNIRDTLLCYLIERKTKDLEMVQRLADITVTRNDKCFKKSIALTNFVNKYAREQGLVMGTNKNTTYGEESQFFKDNFLNNNDVIELDPAFLKLFQTKDKYGAYVSNPELNEEVGMEIFNGILSKYLWEYVCDEDFSSLYPSCYRAFNIDSQNIVGKFYCKDDEVKARLKNEFNCSEMFQLSIKDNGFSESEEEDDEDDDDEDSEDVEKVADKSKIKETDDLCSVFADLLISHNWNMIGNIMFNLPTTEELAVRISKRS